MMDTCHIEYKEHIIEKTIELHHNNSIGFKEAIQKPMKKSLQIPKGKSEAVNRRRTDNTMTKRKEKRQTIIRKHYT